MILLDWTRMGKCYCLAGVVADRGRFRVVRPLSWAHHDSPLRNVGWSPYQVDGLSRWQLFELVNPRPAEPEPPHTEDVWVKTLRPLPYFAPAWMRRDILTATLAPGGSPIFGEPFQQTRTAAYLVPGTGERSLVTVSVPADRIAFYATQRVGTAEVDVRVRLDIPELPECQLPVKDHSLLGRVEQWADHPEGQAEAVTRLVREMGNRVAVRLGLSRAFQSGTGNQSYCWLMADGFFSLRDPQP